MYEDNLTFLRAILEQAATEKNRDAVTQKIGDYYARVHGRVQGREAWARNRMQPELDAIANLKSTSDLAPLVAKLQLTGVGVLFDSGPEQDPDNSDAMIVGFGAGRPGTS